MLRFLGIKWIYGSRGQNQHIESDKYTILLWQSLIMVTLDSNHGSGSHPNEDIKVFKKHRVSDHLYTILLSMVSINGD